MEGHRDGMGCAWVGSSGCEGVSCHVGKGLWQLQPQGAPVLPRQPAVPVVLHLPHPSLTFHEDSEDIPEDGEGGAEDEDREEEGADGVCNLALGLQRAGSV